MLYQPLQSGHIELHGANLRELDPESERSRISLVAQDSTLFYGTVEDNLRMARPDASPAQIREAAVAANAHDFIMELPDNISAAAFAMAAMAGGSVRAVKTTPLLTVDEGIQAMHTASELGYRPPAGN